MLVRFGGYPATRSIFNDISSFERDIDSLFGSFLGAGQVYGAQGGPAMDMSDHGEELHLVAELPGLKKEDLKLSIHDGLLTLSGERKESDLPENASWLRNELWRGSFSRSIHLPYPVDASRVKAELANGILTVVLPKAAEARPKEIRIR